MTKKTGVAPKVTRVEIMHARKGADERPSLALKLMGSHSSPKLRVSNRHLSVKIEKDIRYNKKNIACSIPLEGPPLQHMRVSIHMSPQTAVKGFIC